MAANKPFVTRKSCLPHDVGVRGAWWWEWRVSHPPQIMASQPHGGEGGSATPPSEYHTPKKGIARGAWLHSSECMLEPAKALAELRACEEKAARSSSLVIEVGEFSWRVELLALFSRRTLRSLNLAPSRLVLRCLS